MSVFLKKIKTKNTPLSWPTMILSNKDKTNQDRWGHKLYNQEIECCSQKTISNNYSVCRLLYWCFRFGTPIFLIKVARFYCNVWHFGELQIKPQPTKIWKHSRASKTNYFLSPYFSKITKLWENWFKEFRYVCHSTGLTYGNFR